MQKIKFLMFKEGNILYFNPFYFDNGNLPKPKYFLVLKEVDGQFVLASLPTSHDHIPSNVEKIHGCIDDSMINFNCYYFQAGRVVAYNEKENKEFFFPRDTYVYGYRISFFDLNKFAGLIKEGFCIVSYKGKMIEEEYKQLRDCLKKSSSVKRMFRTLL